MEKQRYWEANLRQDYGAEKTQKVFYQACEKQNSNEEGCPP